MTRYRDAIFKLESRTLNVVLEEPKKLEKPEKPVKAVDEVKPTPDATSSLHAAPQKTLRMYFRRAVLVYSRVQQKMRLSFDTLFRAIALYKASQQLNQQKGEIPQDYLLVGCLYISMKYEEIYPPRLIKLLHILNMGSLSLKEYCRQEKAIVLLLGGNLNVPSLKVKMDSYLPGQSKQVYLYSYYLLELSLQQDKLLPFSWEQLCLAVLFLMTSYGDLLKKKKRVDQGVSEPRIDECAKLLIKARYQATEKVSKYFIKYSSETYKRVAESPTFLRLE